MKKKEKTVQLSRGRYINGIKLFFMILPFLVLVFIFSYYPLYGWACAFFNYNPGKTLLENEFVGLKWFKLLFSDELYRADLVRVMRNTLGMSFLNIGTSFLPMLFAVLLAEISNIRYRKVVQTVSTIPNFVSWVLVYAVAYSMFSSEDGFINRLLVLIGVLDKNQGINFLASVNHMWLKMWLWQLWKGLGWGAVTYIAAMSGIDREQLEAAEVDGANRWQKIRYITLPSLIPTFFVLLVLSIGNLINNGTDQYYVFQTPLNRESIEVLDLYVYNQGLKGGLYAYTTAVGMMKSVVSIALLTFANWLSKIVRGSSVF